MLAAVRDAGDWRAAVGPNHWERRTIALLAGVAIVVAACGPEPFLDDGTTFGKSDSFELDAGTQTISWSAWDAAEPADGCLFGLILDAQTVSPPDATQPLRFSIPKLAYQVLGGGETLNGQAVLELPAGTYGFVIEGSCFWSVRVDRH